ncbi:unnamed protein product [Ectocarpus sp. 12 AP-2014]
MSNKRKMSLLSSFENISPQVISRVGREIQDLQRNPPDGIRFLPQEEDTIAEIHAEIKGPVGTPYDGGSFHIKLVLSNDFPHSPPRGFFLTKIYHPNVAPNGDICVNTLKRDWTAEVTMTHVLQVIRCLLIVPFPESSLNDEAGRLFMESYTEYERRVKVWVNVHASKSLSSAPDGGEATSGGSSSGSGAAIKGGVVKAGGNGDSGAAVAAAAAPAAAAVSGKKTAPSGKKGSSSAKVAGGSGAVGGVAGGKRREDAGAATAAGAAAAPRKTVKDRQKEAKKKGLKRL